MGLSQQFSRNCQCFTVFNTLGGEFLILQARLNPAPCLEELTGWGSPGATCEQGMVRTCSNAAREGVEGSVQLGPAAVLPADSEEPAEVSVSAARDLSYPAITASPQ